MKTIRQHFIAFIPFLLTLAVLCCLFANGVPNAAAADSYYLSENSNVDTIHATTVGAMPCIGEAKIIVFYVDFKGGEVNWTKTKEEVEKTFFSEEGKTDPSVAYSEADSLRSYYYRSSYGKVDITGSVFEYQTQYDTSYYTDLHMALNEVIDYYRDAINWDEYDGNNDGYIDGIYLIARNKHSFGGPNYVSTYSNEVGNKKICKACFLDTSWFNTMCHETCHMFGPADMYGNVGLNPAGIQTACIMDEGYGDLPSPTKFILGWLDNVTFISSDNIGPHNLRSYSYYGDTLVIYPNGDPTNNNWLFVEFVTNGGNNTDYRIQDGLRVWKTQMNIDEDYNINGATEYCSGMPASPYEYLEAVHRDNVPDYYIPVGQEITPYTYPSTAYSNTFYNEGGCRYLADLTFSGISISFVNRIDNLATVEVGIDASADTTCTATATLTTYPADESSAFLDNKNSITFASLTFDREIKVTTPPTLTSQSAGKTYTLQITKNINNRTLQLGFSPSILSMLKAYDDWTLSIPGITTYYGASATINSGAETFSFSNYPEPLNDYTQQYYTNFNLSFPYNLKYFAISESTILTIYFDNNVKKLYWGEIDTEADTTTKHELQLPEDLKMLGWETPEDVKVWKDHDVYFVYIGNYICCYSDKNLIASYDLTAFNNTITFKGTDGQSYFTDYTAMYEMSFENNVISLNPLTLDNVNIPAMLTTNIYSFAPNQYIVASQNIVRFLDREKGIAKEFSYADNNQYGLTKNTVLFLDNTYYVFSFSTDLTMHKFDAEFNLISETCLLKNLSSTIWGPFNLNISFDGNSWMIYFDSVSNANAISYSNSYMILCDENGQVINYYKYGDSSFTFLCQFVRMSPYKIVGVSANEFMYFQTGCEHADFSEWEPIDELQHQRICSCGKVEIEDHTFNENGTCTACGEQKQIPGDFDSNNRLTSEDAIYLLLNTLFGEETYPINDRPADMDGNGTIDQDDAIYLLLHVMFGEVFYPLAVL